LNFLLALADLATSATVVAVYRQVRAANDDWALWSLILGLAFSILTALDRHSAPLAESTGIEPPIRPGDLLVDQALLA
jgi:hypothetical protein